MTDFIHEQPGKHPAPPPEKPTTEKERVRKVYVYVAILFTAAFVLILWSFLMTHRSNQQVLDQMEGSTTYLQNMLAQNQELENENKNLAGENDALESRIAALEQQLAAAESDAAQQQADHQREAEALALEALHVSRLAQAYALHDAGDDDGAREWLSLVSPAYLPLYDADGTQPSPVSAYLALYSELTAEN